jgi:gamma-glutamylcyclotransferase (GGCT)/AIG2-like uncharacterized protein YtfP
MSTDDEATENLFSYGTLQQDDVQLATFGRRLEGTPDVLAGYARATVPVEDPDVVAATGETHYRNVRFTGVESDLVDGTVFAVTAEELERADAYEAGADYARVLVELQSGTRAWVYLNTTG